MRVLMFHVGDRVETRKGGRMRGEGPFRGVITGFSTWRGYDAANVKKDHPRTTRGATVQCLLQNLKLISRARKHRITGQVSQ